MEQDKEENDAPDSRLSRLEVAINSRLHGLLAFVFNAEDFRQTGFGGDDLFFDDLCIQVNVAPDDFVRILLEVFGINTPNVCRHIGSIANPTVMQISRLLAEHTQLDISASTYTRPSPEEVSIFLSTPYVRSVYSTETVDLCNTRCDAVPSLPLLLYMKWPIFNPLCDVSSRNPCRLITLFWISGAVGMACVFYSFMVPDSMSLAILGAMITVLSVLLHNVNVDRNCRLFGDDETLYKYLVRQKVFFSEPQSD